MSCIVLAHMLTVDPVHITNCILFSNVMHVPRPIAVTHSVEMLRHNKRIKVAHRFSTEKLYHYKTCQISQRTCMDQFILGRQDAVLILNLFCRCKWENGLFKFSSCCQPRFQIHDDLGKKKNSTISHPDP